MGVVHARALHRAVADVPACKAIKLLLLYSILCLLRVRMLTLEDIWVARKKASSDCNVQGESAS